MTEHDHSAHGHQGDHCHSGADAAPDGDYDHIPEGYDGVVWTCPMHPQVREVSNSGCPICGMSLEPETVTAEEDTSELVDMTRRFWVGLILSAPLIVFVMGEMIPGNPLIEFITRTSLTT